MKRFTKTILMMMIVAFVISGCGLFTLGEVQDREQVIAEVNGEKILKGELLDLYNEEKAYYEIDESDEDPETLTMISELKLWILDQLIYQKLIAQKAKEAGFVENAETLANANSELEEIIISIAEEFKLEDEQLGEPIEGKDYLRLATTFIQEQLDAMGWTKEYYINLRSEQMLIEQFLMQMVEDVNVSDEEVQSYYDEQLRAQMDNPENIYYQAIKLYEPEKARIKYIVVEFTEDQLNEYGDLVKDEKQEEADLFLDDALKLLQAKAHEIAEQLGNGEDFDDLIQIHTPDLWVDNYEDGYLLSQGEQFIPELEAAIFALAAGGISQPIETDHGYYLVKVYETVSPRIFTLAEIQEEIRASLNIEIRNIARDERIEQWLTTATISRFEKRL